MTPLDAGHPLSATSLDASPGVAASAATWPQKVRRLAAAAAMLVLAACGGSGGVNDTPTASTTPSAALPPAAAASSAATGSTSGASNGASGASVNAPPGAGGALQAGGISGTGRQVFAYGQITAFGSVWVNGVRYQSQSATITKDGVTVPESVLRVGMVVRLEGSLDDAAARRIVVATPLRGPVESVLDDHRMRVMGQWVQIDDRTRFEGGVRPLIGDMVDVHGHALGDGRFTAFHVERSSNAAAPSVKGTVSQHDVAARRFMVGSLTVEYAGATIERLPETTWNGLAIEVQGRACAEPVVCTTLTATKVQALDDSVASATRAEIEGSVSSLGVNHLTIGNATVLLSTSTIFEGGTRDDVMVGSLVEAEGSVEGGRLTATRIIFRDSVRLEGDVSSIGVSSITLAGLGGVLASTNPWTEWKGLARDGANALAVGHHVRARGRTTAQGTVVLSEVELRSTRSDRRVVLQGPLDSWSPYDSLSVLNHQADVRDIDESQFYDASDRVIGRLPYFSALGRGTIVKLRGSLDNGVVRWERAELEN